MRFLAGILNLHFREIKNRLKYLLNRTKLYNSDPMKLSDNFYNYHPQVVIKELEKAGFVIKQQIPVGLFRVSIIKKIIPAKVLIFIEKWGSMIISKSFMAPNIYIVAQKIVDKAVDNTDLDTNYN